MYGGKEHLEAKNNYNEATQLIDKLTYINKEAFVIEYFERVKAEILLEKEVNMQKFVAYYQQLVYEVHERKVQCVHNLRTQRTLEGELDAIKQTMAREASRFKNQNARVFLSALDGDEARWADIHLECAHLLDKVRTLEREFKERIIGDQMTAFKPSTTNQHIQIESICGVLDKGTIDSTILGTRKMKNDLVELCKLSGKQFNLLYRATRDGFAAASFHAKCDHQPRTLTIIKTTSGCVFGGYTSLGWNSSSGWRTDPDAFLFSLVNFRCVPRLMPVKVGDRYSIYCNASNGPVFGSGNSIHISNNSNSTMESYSDLGQSYEFTLYSYGTVAAQSFLAGIRNFQTTEIEVFQLN